jgi:hypothetical protein
MQGESLPAGAQCGASAQPENPHGLVVEFEPDKVRLGRIESAMVDDLVEHRVARTAGLSAHVARREILAQVINRGIREVMREDGMR